MGAKFLMRERPPFFTLDPGHPMVWSGELAFLGAGMAPGTEHFHDSSRDHIGGNGANHGTLTNMAIPPTATSGWAWDSYLGRMVTRYDGSDDVVPFADFSLGSSWSFSIWIKCDAALNSYPPIFVAGNSGLAFNVSYVNSFSGGSVAVRELADTRGVLAHYCAVNRAGTHEIWRNGVKSTTPYTGGYGTLSAGLGGTAFGGWFKGLLSDGLIFPTRALAESEIAALARPDNAMLEIGGRPLLVPVWQRVFKAAVAPVTGAVMNQFQGANLGASLFNGTFLGA